MNPFVEFLQNCKGTVFINEDGLKDDFRLKAPLTAMELLTFEISLPCPLPTEVRELLRFAGGIRWSARQN
jgi:hypothetical protein